MIDYAQEDFAARGESYDLIVDVLGRSSFAHCRQALTPDGVYLPVSFKMKALMQMSWTKVAGRQKVICALSNERLADLEFFRELIEAGHYQSIVDRTFPLEQAADAHRYIEEGRRQGSVVLVA